MEPRVFRPGGTGERDGKIDEALRRSNVDAAQGTGAETPAPAASPWRVEEREVRGAPEAGGAFGVGPTEGAPAGRLERGRGEHGRHARPGGFDSGAIERLVVSKTAAPLLVEQFRASQPPCSGPGVSGSSRA